MDEIKITSVVLRLPSTLSSYSGGKSQILLQANTLEELFAVLARQHPAVWACLCTTEGHIRSHVRIFVNNSLVTDKDDLAITLSPGQEVIVLPTTT